MPDTQLLAHVIDPTLHRSRPRGGQARDLLTQDQRRLLAALEAGDPANPELTNALTSEQLSKLARFEKARRQQLAAAAYRSLSNARREGTDARFHFDRAVAALRYLPLNPVLWLKWLRRRRLGQRFRQHFRACAIAAGGAFDADWYVRNYPDVAKSNIDPLLHFVRLGAMEGRDPAPSCSTKKCLHSMLEMDERYSRGCDAESEQ